jgi:RNA polymerase sigma-70 factor (ECF subfamily)
MLHDQEIARLVRICQDADRARPKSESGADDARAQDAWAGLYRRFHPQVLAFCRRTLPGGSGEDLAAEIMMKARFRLDSFDASRPFGPWLFRVAANRCWDEARKNRRTEPLDDEDANRLAADSPSPLERLITEERREQVRGALSRLPLRQRFALTLRYGAGLSYQEIADTLGISRTNVGVLLLRARRRMRDQLAGPEVS